MDVDVAIRTPDGTLQILKMAPNSTVVQLKRQIETELQIPEAFQILVDPSGEILRRSSDRVHSGDADYLSLVISIEHVCTRLNQGIGIKETIGIIANASKLCKGNDQVIAAVSAHLEHQDRSVRLAAVNALSSIAEQGDQHAFDAVAAVGLKDQDRKVRHAAVNSLPNLANTGDEYAIDLVTDLLLSAEDDYQVRDAARDALLKMGMPHAAVRHVLLAASPLQ
jgi:hypothetical protein